MFSRTRKPSPSARRLSFDVLENRLVLSPTVIATIPFGSSRAGEIAANPATNLVYAAQEDFRRIAVIDGAENQVIATVSTDGFHTGIAADPISNRIYVSQQFSGTVRIIDGTTNGIITDLPVPGLIHTIGDVAVNPATNRLYVVRANNQDVAVFDTTTLTFLSAIPSGASTGLAVDSGTNRIYVANNLSDQVTVIDGFTNAILATIAVGDHPYKIGVNPVSHRIYVSNHSSDSVSIIDGTPGSPLENSVLGAPILVGDGPLDIGVNPLTGRAYVANVGSDTVSVIDEATETVVATVDVGDQPQHIAVIPETSLVYVTNDNGHSVSVIEDLECTPIPDGLVAWYRGEGDATDWTGQHSGTGMNGLTYANGRVGQAMQFDGFDDFVHVAHHPDLNPTEGLTLEAWIKSDSNDGPRVIASKWNDNTGDWSYIFKDWNLTDTLSIELSRSTHNDLAQLIGPTPLTPGQWIHVATTFDGSTVRLYVNGVEDTALAVPPGSLIDSSVTDFLIGAVFTGGGILENFAGLIDELSLYNRPLTEEEIQSIVRAGSAGKCANRPPVADAGGPYTVVEGGSLVLDGSGSSDLDQPANTLIFDWDLDDDGLFGETGTDATRGDETGPTPTLFAASLDGPSFEVVTLRVTDAEGAIGLDSVIVEVLNAVPVITAFSSSSPSFGGAIEGQRVTVSGRFTDAGVLDTHTGVIDWGDGMSSPAVISEANGVGTVSGNHVYRDGGKYTITLTLTDDDEDSATAQASALIAGVGVQSGALVVYGTNRNDQVLIAQPTGTSFLVTSNLLKGGQKTLNAAGVDRVLAVMANGDDQVTIAGNVRMPTRLDGGEGRDQLRGGANVANVLVGGAGNDSLIGGNARDLLFGGLGADFLAGNGDDDVLVGGTTRYDDDEVTLERLRSDWTRVGPTYEQRVDLLRLTLNNTTAFDDGAVDRMQGGGGLDWFLASLRGRLSDLLSDRALRERVEEIR